MLVRAEKESDREAVFTLHASAFETSAEARLVDALREQAQPIVSLVAEDKGIVHGHIMFSPVSLSGNTDSKMMGLAPMAVALESQRKGIGSALVRAGLDECRQLGIAAVVVLGYPDYYVRFGFVSSRRFGIESEYDVPEDVFMALELRPGSLTGKAGTIAYHGAFSDL